MLFLYLYVITVKIIKKEPVGLEEGSGIIQVWCLGFLDLHRKERKAKLCSLN